MDWEIYPDDNKYKEFKKEPEYKSTLNARFTFRWFNGGIKIRGFDENKLDGLEDLPIEKDEGWPKLVIVKRKTPLYFKIDGVWKEYKLYGREHDEDYETQSVFVFNGQDGDKLKLTGRQFMLKCDHQEVALQKGGNGLIMSKGGGVWK